MPNFAQANRGGPLHGMPYAAKICWIPTGLRRRGVFPSIEIAFRPSDATVIRKLEDAGAVLLAKTKLSENWRWTMSGSVDARATRGIREKGSSGSSAGSAAAVAAGLVPFAIGSETTARRFAREHFGVTGWRPSVGRAARGATLCCWNFDKIGPLAAAGRLCAGPRRDSRCGPGRLRGLLRPTRRGRVLPCAPDRREIPGWRRT